jgi:hypothetical protein
MKTEYHEGPEALVRFEKGHDRLFHAPEPTVKKAAKTDCWNSKNLNCSGRCEEVALTARTGQNSLTKSLPNLSKRQHCRVPHTLSFSSSIMQGRGPPTQIDLRQKPVKPQNRESPRQSSTFAWRIS